MALYIKSPAEVAGIKKAGKSVARVFQVLEENIAPGISLRELENICVEEIKRQGGKPTFLKYRGFPAAVCISINEEVVHGIPDSRRLQDGDIVKVDIGVTKDGFIADAARTFLVGEVRPEIVRLARVTQEAFFRALEFARVGYRVGDISYAIQDFVERAGFSVVRELHGHGVGIELHEEPTVPNFGKPGQGRKLVNGMTLAIEPMVNMGTAEVKTLKNGWTVVTVDGKPSAHYENTVLITDGKPEILTQ